MKSILICLGISSLLLGGAFLFGVIFSEKPTVLAQEEYTVEREFSQYVDINHYYDTVIFTEEDSILSIY